MLIILISFQALRLPTVTSVKVPEGFPDWKAVPDYLMKK